MSASVRPRGPLPARVYWTRRLVVLGVPLLLVVVLARVLGGSADGADGDVATQSSAPTGTATPARLYGPTAAPPPRKGKKSAPPKPVLAEPSGECEPADIVATPDVSRIPGGSAVDITVNLRTRLTEACTWEVTPRTFAVTITSGNDHIWSSQECPASIPTGDVVVRRAVDAPVAVTWHARRSDEECSRFTDWARPGFYHVKAAALGGEATDVQFELVAPSAPVVTRTAEPKPQKKKSKPRDFKPGQDGAGNTEG